MNTPYKVFIDRVQVPGKTPVGALVLGGSLVTEWSQVLDGMKKPSDVATPNRGQNFSSLWTLSLCSSVQYTFNIVICPEQVGTLVRNSIVT
jgi:hypothetical protein